MDLPYIFSEIAGLFADKDQRGRIILLALLASIGGLLEVIVVCLIMAMPVTHVTHHIVVDEKAPPKIVYVETKPKYPPLTNAADACTGRPVEIKQMSLGGSTDYPTNTFTWLTVRPLGDDYTVKCVMGGDQHKGWHVGDHVAVTGSGTG